MILSLVSKTLLFLRNSLIPLYQSSNFVQSLSNHPRSGTMLLGITTCMFLFVCTGVPDISVSVHSLLLEASSIICKDPNYSNNAFILSVCLELVLVLFCSFYYIYFVLWQVTLSSFVHKCYLLYFSCKMSSLMLYQILQP